MNKKIKVTISKKIYDIVKNDIEDFQVSTSYFMNFIFTNLKDTYKSLEKKELEIDILNKEKKFLQFNLNKQNFLIYYDVLKDKKILNESEFFRTLLIKYSTKPKNIRELFIYKEIVERINLAIEDKKNISITFKDNRKSIVSPYYIGSSDLEIANYIFCYDLIEKKYKNYKLINLKQVYTLSDKANWSDEKYIKETIKNFDPFLSQGNKIKVRFSNEGILLLKSLKLNRPKQLSKNENIYEFECSQEQAKRYFSYFLDNALIIEPLELRKWFEKKYKNALKIIDNYEADEEKKWEKKKY